VRPRRESGERGSAAVELALCAPALLLLVAVIVGAGRVVSTKSAVLAVAREAARVAAEASNSQEAGRVAADRAHEVASGLGLDPARLQLTQFPGNFGRGQSYAVAVSYRVELSDLPALGFLPGSFTVSARHAECVERYKSR